VFSTKGRRPYIKKEIQNELWLYLTGILKNNGCRAIQTGGMDDHVHLLFSLSRTKTVADIVETLKSHSSRWIKLRDPASSRFQWQPGYGAFSISKSDSEKVIAYIINQPLHHKKRSFKEEFLELLRLYEVEYDPEYLWIEEN
jgi:REP element-mobilizing transposase RayT